MKYESIIKNYFAAWQQRDWDFVENTITEDFTFTSPYDNYIKKDEYKHKCWDTVNAIDPFELATILEKEDEVFVRYKGRVNGEAVQNAEHFIFQNGKLKSVTVFFGRPDDDAPSDVN